MDPGGILYRARQGRSFTEIEDLHYRQSGLLGVSGISGDVHVLIASDDPRAREAIDLFADRIATEVGGFVSTLRRRRRPGVHRRGRRARADDPH